ncbi:MAG: hypothetical protein LUF87_07270 [Alistipes sp.]|nr:hypothetical protein [Alistipes sp.]
MIMGLQLGQPKLPDWEKIAIVATLFALLCLLVFIIFTYPIKILMWDGTFLIRRLCGNKVINHEDIKYIHRIKKQELDRNSKLLGKGGLRGY